jgi:hypothetical protein
MYRTISCSAGEKRTSLRATEIDPLYGDVRVDLAVAPGFLVKETKLH